VARLLPHIMHGESLQSFAHDYIPNIYLCGAYMKRFRCLISGFLIVLGLGIGGCGPIVEDEITDDKKTLFDNDELIDTIPPIVIIKNPTNGYQVGASYQLIGTVTDDKSGVDKVFYNINNGEWREAGVSGFFWFATISGITSLGFYTNRVYAVDKAGNVSIITNKVWVERTDVPSITIESPENGSLFNNSSITVSGTASVDTPKSITKVEVQVNGGEWIIASGTESWSVNISLTEGNNTVVARATDDNDKSSLSAEWNINLDTTPPSLSILNPDNGDYVGKNYEIAIDADDENSGVDKVFYDLNDNNWAEASFNGSMWIASVSLNGDGSFINRVYAVDNAGNSSATNQVTVEHNSTPWINITYPANGASVGSTSINLEGNAGVSSPYEIVKVEVQVNGGEWITASGTESWSVNISLTEGNNSISARAITDDDKITYSEDWAVTLDLTYPVVTIESPENGSLFNNSSITVSGTASVDAPKSITKVEVQVNGGEWIIASGTESWSVNISLTEGNNSISARATDDESVEADSTPMTYIYEKILFVSTVGNDADDGTRTHPVRSIQTALDKAEGLGITEIYISEGTYTPGNGLNIENENYKYSGVYINIPNLTITGGWDTDFTGCSGMSLLDGNNNLKHIIYIDDFDNITIKNFEILNGNADDTSIPHNSGGGIYINQGNGHNIDNTIISQNSARNNGGGIYINNGVNHTLNATVSYNTLTANASLGAGIAISEGTSIVINGIIEHNTSSGQSAKGGGIYINGGSEHTIDTIVRDNELTGNSSIGGGIHVSDGINHLIQNEITGNSANSGAGVCIENGDSHTIDANITDNNASSANGSGGGLYLINGLNHIIKGNILYNSAKNGGGVYFSQSGAPNNTHTFDYPVIGGNAGNGVDRLNVNSNPQGTGTIDFTPANTPGNITW